MEITAELTRYVMVYYQNLLTAVEYRAWRHTISLEKIDGKADNRRALYLRTGWLSEETEVLALLENGFGQFAVNCTKRILAEHPDKVYLNFCAKCGELARTPYAKQCRVCGYDWHHESDSI